MEDKEELKFPLSFDQCPNCGSERKIAGEILKQEKEKGKISPGVKAFISTSNSVIADMGRTWLSAPIISTFYDVCGDCGTYYCIHAELGIATPQLGQQPPQVKGFGGN